ncbi:MAG: copper homeostasis protein CutC [Microbacterium gubbeenense]
MTAFELAVQDPTGVAIAERVRPTRMELCSALSTGGVTPSAGLIEQAVATGVPVHVLVRPREGGFTYDDVEKRTILADVRHAMSLGAAGAVIGGLVGDAVDLDLVVRVRAASDGEVTFHRAFDQLSDQRAALDQLAEAGVARVLTSGGRSAAADALVELRALAAHAAGLLQVMAGAGVTSRNAASIAATGVDAVHASAKRTVTDRLTVSLGSAAGAGETRYATTDEDEATVIREILASGAAL